MKDQHINKHLISSLKITASAFEHEVLEPLTLISFCIPTELQTLLSFILCSFRPSGGKGNGQMVGVLVQKKEEPT